MKDFIPGLIIRPNRVRRLAAPIALATYVAPADLDYRSQLLKTSDQAITSKCAAYAMAGRLEYSNWKADGIVQQIDPHPIYARAIGITLAAR